MYLHKNDCNTNILTGDGRETSETIGINIGLSKNLYRISAEHADGVILTSDLKSKYSDILDKTKPTICVCHHGMRSQRVAMFLTQQAGFEEVYNLTGGVNEYANKVDSSIGFY